MRFFGFKWGSMGSVWFAEVQCGSLRFNVVHRGSLRFMWVL